MVFIFLAYFTLYNGLFLDRIMGFPGGLMVKNLPATQESWRHGFPPWVENILWKRKWQPIPAFLHGKFHGEMSLVHGVAKESDTTEQAHSNNRQKNITISCFPNSEEYGHHLFQISIALEFPKSILHYHYVCIVHISFLNKELYFGHVACPLWHIYTAVAGVQ